MSQFVWLWNKDPPSNVSYTRIIQLITGIIKQEFWLFEIMRIIRINQGEDGTWVLHVYSGRNVNFKCGICKRINVNCTLLEVYTRSTQILRNNRDEIYY